MGPDVVPSPHVSARQGMSPNASAGGVGAARALWAFRQATDHRRVTESLTPRYPAPEAHMRGDWRLVSAKSRDDRQVAKRAA
jgi:hypothetical protein